MVHTGHLEGAEFHQYREKVRKHMGTTMGPIGVEVDASHKWMINGKWTHIEDIENLAGLVRGKARDRMWQQLSKQRHTYQGRDEGASDALGKTLEERHHPEL